MNMPLPPLPAPPPPETDHCVAITPVPDHISGNSAEEIAKAAAADAMMEMVRLGLDKSGETKGSVKIAALQEITNRALGRVPQSSETTVNVTTIIQQINRARGNVE